MKVNSNLNKTESTIVFNSGESTALRAVTPKLKLYDKFIKSQENLSSTRFIQDVVTNWVPKVVFTRSLADFTEMTFLEFTESSLFYFAPPILGAALSKSFAKFAPKNLRSQVLENITKPSLKLIEESKVAGNTVAKRANSIKAAMILGCVAIPAGEYALSFAKNLLTLKLFKQSNFDNIANLNKGSQQVESKEHQEKVKKSAKKHISNATKLSAFSLCGGVLLATVGHKSEILQKICRAIIRPGAGIAKGLEKLGLKSEKLSKNLDTYINFDFDTSKGKLGLSKGQLVVSTLSGLLGYSEAGKDRGKLDQLEVLTRVPFVVFYTVFGSAAFDYAFKHILHKKNKFSDLIKKGADGKISIPTRAELPQLAEKAAKIKNTAVKAEFDRLLKEKAIITAIPYGFSLVFMGFLLAGITRFWTQYRFNQEKKTSNTTQKVDLKAR